MQNRNYNDFREGLPPATRSLFDSLRAYCLSLGKNVIEDVSWFHIFYYTRGESRRFLALESHEESIIVYTMVSNECSTLHEISPISKYTELVLPHVSYEELKRIIHDSYLCSMTKMCARFHFSRYWPNFGKLFFNSSFS